MRLLILLLLLLEIPLITTAQETDAPTGTVEGTVLSGDEPVVGVNVVIAPKSRGTSTDRKGTFRINLPEGDYRLVVSAIGYEDSEQDIRVTARDTLRLNIHLTEKLEELGEVVVTGTMRETFVKESPVKVAVVKPQRLQQGGTSSNIMDLIDNVGGLSTQLNCGVCGTNAIRVNGVEGPNTAVLIDGMPIMGALASVYGLNGISPSIIDQVEVIKGPQSTLYGTQALGGVVNIITKNPAYTPAFSAELFGKSTKEGNLNLAYSPKFGRFRGFVSGNLVQLENYIDRNDDSFNDLPKQSRVALFGKGTLSGEQG
ncbi:MAG: carboxypeptidase-like regulatory domain-containing protein, partial [Balneolaceae bacterium]|nr:carboxypeptidase-like regulatory domain-containing protein [Balneolaceae bacterium]